MKTIEELGKEYEQILNIIDMRINERKEKLQKIQHLSKQSDILKKEIKILYNERLDVLLTAKHLINYYEIKGEKNELFH
jgi:hypothetical protein